MNNIQLLDALERLMPGPLSSESELLQVQSRVHELLQEVKHLTARRTEIDNEAYDYSEQLAELARRVKQARPLLTKYLADHEDELRKSNIYDNACAIVDRLDAAIST